MGMGCIPWHDWTISQEHLRNLMPQAWDSLSQVLDRYGISLKEVALAKSQEEAVRESAEACEAIINALNRLDREFQEVTRVEESCLGLELFYYSAAEGSRYDELDDGANWLVYGAEQLTPAGKKFQDRIAWKGWTSYG